MRPLIQQILKDTLDIKEPIKPHSASQFTSISYYREAEFHEYLDRLSVEVCVDIFILLFLRILIMLEKY
jgi:hypothetical protein